MLSSEFWIYFHYRFFFFFLVIVYNSSLWLFGYILMMWTAFCYLYGSSSFWRSISCSHFGQLCISLSPLSDFFSGLGCACALDSFIRKPANLHHSPCSYMHLLGEIICQYLEITEVCTPEASCFRFAVLSLTIPKSKNEVTSWQLLARWLLLHCTKTSNVYTHVYHQSSPPLSLLPFWQKQM